MKVEQKDYAWLPGSKEFVKEKKEKDDHSFIE
jgi:hypothetical protein